MSEAIHPIDEFARRASSSMPASALAYLDGGAVDEISVRGAAGRFSEIRLLPRVGVDVSELDMSCRVLGVDLPFPIMLAPAALQLLFSEEGEAGSVRGARTAGTSAVISMESSIATRDLAPEAGPFFQHIYIQKDRDLTLECLRMAEEAGARGIAVTLDNPVPGIRYRQDAGMLGLPDGVRRANLESGGVPRLTGGYLDASVTWKDLEWLVERTELPVIGKGILHPDDADRAIDAGAAAVYVSNHGARNLDTVVDPIDCVRPVSEAVGGRVPILFDGGVRRGTDVLKALALGADVALIGRPYVWGLAADGAAGVVRVLEILRDELAAAMAMCGVARLEDLSPSLIHTRCAGRRS